MLVSINFPFMSANNIFLWKFNSIKLISLGKLRVISNIVFIKIGVIHNKVSGDTYTIN